MLKSMAEDEFPTGCILTEVSITEDKEFGGEECLDQVQLILQNTEIILRSLAHTDEIVYQTVTSYPPENTPTWCSEFLGKKLQTVWVLQHADSR